MLSMLRLYTSGRGRGWQESSLLVATSVGRGLSLAQSLCGWLWDFLEDSNQLPFSLYCGSISRIEDGDLANEI